MACSAEQLARTILKSTKPRPPLCADCLRLIPNAIVYEKIEAIIESMLLEEGGLYEITHSRRASSFSSSINASSNLNSNSNKHLSSQINSGQVFTGSDLIKWMQLHLDLESDNLQEATHLANLIASYGYIFPVDDSHSNHRDHSHHHQHQHHQHHHHHHLHYHFNHHAHNSTHNYNAQLSAFQVKNDNTIYCFQAPCLWPSNWDEPDNLDYAIYLCKRSILLQSQSGGGGHHASIIDNSAAARSHHNQINQSHQHQHQHGSGECGSSGNQVAALNKVCELADYELETLARLQRVYSAKWAEIRGEAERRIELERNSCDKLQLRVLEMQERAFWSHFKPFPGCVSGRELDMKKMCRISKVARNCVKCREEQLKRANNDHANASSSASANVNTDDNGPSRACCNNEDQPISILVANLTAASQASFERLCDSNNGPADNNSMKGNADQLGRAQPGGNGLLNRREFGLRAPSDQRAEQHAQSTGMSANWQINSTWSAPAGRGRPNCSAAGDDPSPGISASDNCCGPDGDNNRERARADDKSLSAAARDVPSDFDSECARVEGIKLDNDERPAAEEDSSVGSKKGGGVDGEGARSRTAATEIRMATGPSGSELMVALTNGRAGDQRDDGGTSAWPSIRPITAGQGGSMFAPNDDGNCAGALRNSEQRNGVAAAAKQVPENRDQSDNGNHCDQKLICQVNSSDKQSNHGPALPTTPRAPLPASPPVLPHLESGRLLDERDHQHHYKTSAGLSECARETRVPPANGPNQNRPEPEPAAGERQNQQTSGDLSSESCQASRASRAGAEGNSKRLQVRRQARITKLPASEVDSSESRKLTCSPSTSSPLHDPANRRPGPNEADYERDEQQQRHHYLDLTARTCSMPAPDCDSSRTRGALARHIAPDLAEEPAKETRIAGGHCSRKNLANESARLGAANSEVVSSAAISRPGLSPSEPSEGSTGPRQPPAEPAKSCDIVQTSASKPAEQAAPSRANNRDSPRNVSSANLLNYDRQRHELSINHHHNASPNPNLNLNQGQNEQQTGQSGGISIRKSSFDLIFGRSNSSSSPMSPVPASGHLLGANNHSGGKHPAPACSHPHRARLSVSLASSVGGLGTPPNSTSHSNRSARIKNTMLNQHSFFGSLISWRQRSESKSDIGKVSSSLRSHLRVGSGGHGSSFHCNQTPGAPPGSSPPSYAAETGSPLTSAKLSNDNATGDNRHINYELCLSDTPTSKSAKIVDSYVGFSRQWADYDPFLVQPVPSNPWLSDSTDFWDNQLQTKEVNLRRVKRWAFSLRELLQDPAGRDQLSHFLEKEFSAENLKFWEAVQKLKRVRLSQVASLVQLIWNEYLSPDANCPINIDSKSFETTKGNLERCKNNRNMYDEAANHVYLLMRNDSYPRYLRSDSYKEFLRTASSLENKKPRSQIQVSFDVFKSQALRQRFNSVAK